MTRYHHIRQTSHYRWQLVTQIQNAERLSSFSLLNMHDHTLISILFPLRTHWLDQIFWKVFDGQLLFYEHVAKQCLVVCSCTTSGGFYHFPPRRHVTWWMSRSSSRDSTAALSLNNAPSHATAEFPEFHWLPVAVHVRLKTPSFIYEDKNAPASSYLMVTVNFCSRHEYSLAWLNLLQATRKTSRGSQVVKRSSSGWVKFLRLA